VHDIDSTRRALVVGRPGQSVAKVLPLDAYDALSGFFEQILVDQS